jgi:GT2 family glycosyltransferase
MKLESLASSAEEPHDEGEPLVSIIIPNCDGLRYLQRCLPSIIAQTYRNLELVLVDNGSTDESVDFAKSLFPSVKALINTRNLGFAKPVNQGIRSSSGDYVLILNNDTVLESNAIRILVDAMRNWQQKGDDVAGVAPKILFFDRLIIDSVGNGINQSGDVFNVGIGQVDLGQFDKPRRVFGLCFAAALIRRDVFEKLGLLDDTYFAYFEDVDWCYRANVLGYKFYSVPSAIVHHHHSASAKSLMMADEKYYLIHRNLIRTLLKNYSPRNLFQPAKKTLIHAYHVLDDLAHMRGAKAWVQFKIVASTLMWLPLLLVKNARINRARVVGDSEVWGLSSERLVQISGYTFHPETYSPYISLDVVEEILQYLSQKASRGSYLEPYLDVHSINYLRRMGLLDLPTRVAEKLATTDVSSGGLRLKPYLGYSREGRLFITQGGQSYMVDRFMLNLLTVMNGRTIEEWARKVLEVSLSGQSSTRLPDSAVRRFARCLEWVATYLARAGMLEGSTQGNDVANPVGAQ